MALRLFRSTGFSSILFPGETRVAMHPGWLVLVTSMWVGFASNVPLWRAISGTGVDLRHAALMGLVVAAVCATLLSLMGWRKTLKPTATVLLLLSALAACGIWAQGLPVDASLLDKHLADVILPTWTNLLRWEVPLVTVLLTLPPMLWVWQVRLRRLSGQEQMRFNMLGMAVGVMLFIATCALLLKGFD